MHYSIFTNGCKTRVSYPGPGVYFRGVATGDIWVFIPPKSAQVNFLWGKNDVRTATQQFYTPKKTVLPPKQISGYAPGVFRWPLRLFPPLEVKYCTNFSVKNHVKI